LQIADEERAIDAGSAGIFARSFDRREDQGKQGRNSPALR